MAARMSHIFIFLVSLALMFTPAASAQIISAATVPGAITVTGEGSASAPAESAMVAITIGSDSNVYKDEMPLGPDDDAFPPAIDVTAVVNAIIASGILEAEVVVMETPFMGEWGSGMPAQPVMIMVTVPDPTVDSLSALLDLVRTTAHGEGFLVNQFGILYGIADCRPLRQQARAEAIANARAEAEDQAAALETTVGVVVSSRDVLPMNMGYYQSNSCNTAMATTPYSVIMSAPQFDPGQPAEVTVYLAVEVSFEIP